MECPFSTMYNYLGEDGHCSRCPAYQDCNNAVAPMCEDEDEDEDEDDGDWVVTSEEPVCLAEVSMKRNYSNFYSKLSSVKIAYENESSHQDWKLRQRAMRKKLVDEGIVSFVPDGSIAYLMKVNGYITAVLTNLRIYNYINHVKCRTVFDTVIAMMESK